MKRSLLLGVLVSLAGLCPSNGSATSALRGADPALQHVGSWPYGPSFAVAVDRDRDLVFLGSGGAVLILDVTDRTAPALVHDEIRTAGLVTDATWDPVHRRLFLACEEGGLEIWDVQDPAAPSRLSRTEVLYFGVETPVRDVVLWDHFAVVECAWGYVHCLDVSDPANPVETSFNGTMGLPSNDTYVSRDGMVHTTGQNGYQRLGVLPNGALDSTGSKHFDFGAGAVAGTPSVAYVGYGSTLVLIDLLGATFPIWSVTNVGGVADLVVGDGNAYIVNGDGFRVWNVENPAAPFLVGELLISLSDSRVAVVEGYAYVTDRHEGLRILEIGDGTAPVEVGRWEVPSVVWKTVLAGDRAYVGQDQDGVVVLDLADPARPEEIGRWESPGDTRDLVVAGDVVHVADWTGGYRIVDLSDPAAPVELGAWTGGNAWRVDVSGTTAFVVEGIVNRDDVLRVFDVSDPANIVELGIHEFGDDVWQVVASGAHLFVANSGAGLRVLDVSDPSAPTDVGGFATRANGLWLAGDVLYLTNFFDDELFALDVTNPASPALVGSYGAPGFSPWHLAGAGDWLYVNDFSALSLMDVSDPAHPQLLEQVELSSSITGIAAGGPYVWVCNAEAGVQVFENGLLAPTGVGPIAIAGPDVLQLTHGPNPFTRATTLRWSLPRTADVRLDVLNVAGRRVRSLVDGVRGPGADSAVWNGRDDAGRRVAPGVYLFRLAAGKTVETGRTVLVR